MMTKTAKALEEYDRLADVSSDERKLEALRKKVAIAFSEESPNSVERCLELIYPGPRVPQVGQELSFVRRMVEMSKTSDMKWNPRYVEYARVLGRPPEDQIEQDRKDWPGGCMVGFILWLGQKWKEWYQSIGVGHLPLDQRRYYQDHKAFDLWLKHQKS